MRKYSIALFIVAVTNLARASGTWTDIARVYNHQNAIETDPANPSLTFDDSTLIANPDKKCSYRAAVVVTPSSTFVGHFSYSDVTVDGGPMMSSDPIANMKPSYIATFVIPVDSYQWFLDNKYFQFATHSADGAQWLSNGVPKHHPGDTLVFRMFFFPSSNPITHTLQYRLYLQKLIYSGGQYVFAVDVNFNNALSSSGTVSFILQQKC